MSGLLCKELFLVLDRDGALVAFQESQGAWAGLLGFSSEERAHEFCRDHALKDCQIAAIDSGDASAVEALIGQVKGRAIRYLLLDPDFRARTCIQVEFEGNAFGEARERLLAPHQH